MNFFKETDVVVIGGGIVGTAILRELSKYKLRCLLVEKEPDDRDFAGDGEGKASGNFSGTSQEQETGREDL